MLFLGFLSFSVIFLPLALQRKKQCEELQQSSFGIVWQNNIYTFDYKRFTYAKDLVVMGKRGPKVKFHDPYHKGLREQVKRSLAKKKENQKKKGKLRKG